VTARRSILREYMQCRKKHCRTSKQKCTPGPETRFSYRHGCKLPQSVQLIRRNEGLQRVQWGYKPFNLYSH
jgi:hypothetical protein